MGVKIELNPNLTSVISAWQIDKGHSCKTPYWSDPDTVQNNEHCSCCEYSVYFDDGPVPLIEVKDGWLCQVCAMCHNIDPAKFIEMIIYKQALDTVHFIDRTAKIKEALMKVPEERKGIVNQVVSHQFYKDIRDHFTPSMIDPYLEWVRIDDYSNNMKFTAKWGVFPEESVYEVKLRDQET